MKARIVNIQKFSLHDGPGIRTTVFFKGCPLNCLWCDNPECILPEPEIGFNKTICNCCGKCAEACSMKTITLAQNGLPHINRERCTACGECINVCSPKALALYGKEISLEELFKEVQSDSIFYASSGGVTVSGGEASLQADFVEALFKLCKEAKITTAIETCGHVKPEIFERIIKLVDFAFLDLKSANDQKHLELTGQGNKLIIYNARRLVDSGVKVQFRMPLIPSLNDDLDNIRAISDFLRSLNKDNPFSIEIIPYHRLGIGKYEALDRECRLKDLDMATGETIELAKQRFKACGIDCLVSR
jgi:pyruvate formate lyase activating enzyme